MITIKDMAERAGVSPTTVSNVLHGRPGKVSPETLEKVNKVIKESNYVSNMGARLLANNGSKLIGVLINDDRRNMPYPVQDPFFSELIGALESEIRAHGYYLMLSMVGDVEESLRMASAWNVEGLIIFGFNKETSAKMKRGTDKPIVFIDCYFHEDGITYANVGLDDRDGGYQMTKYLIENGHRRIAFLADNPHPVGADYERLEGCKQALGENGIEFHEDDFINISYDKKERTQILKNIINHRLDDLTALFFASDYYASNAVQFFYDNKIEVPRDISVVGFDDNVFAHLCRPQLTTVHQDVTKKAKIAVQFIQDMIKGNPIEEYDVKLPISLIIRDSVKKI